MTESKIEWVKIENRKDREINYYYLKDETNHLHFQLNDKVTCKLPDGTEEQLILDFKVFQVIWHEGGIPYHTTTKKWFVKNGKNEFQIEDVEILKEDAIRYKNNIHDTKKE